MRKKSVFAKIWSQSNVRVDCHSVDSGDLRGGKSACILRLRNGKGYLQKEL